MMAQGDIWAARRIVRDLGATQHQRNTAFEALVCWTDGARFTPDMGDTLAAWRAEYRRVDPVTRAQRLA